ncbi:MAG: hypothetical protein H0X24_09485 [Ktedonobacterales bacterium]|nr:hypothetical protein [Ktedonobacterales bacterium]
MSQLNGALTGCLGLLLFLIGLAGSQRAGDKPAQARLFLWLTLLGAAFFDVATYGIQFHSPYRRPDMDGAIIFAWSLTGSMALLTAINVVRMALRRAPKRA